VAAVFIASPLRRDIGVCPAEREINGTENKNRWADAVHPPIGFFSVRSKLHTRGCAPLLQLHSRFMAKYPISTVHT
jgi:hypothetical protein